MATDTKHKTPVVPGGLSLLWWAGKDSNLRSASARQIYSLMPLTPRPPTHIFSNWMHMEPTIRFERTTG